MPPMRTALDSPRCQALSLHLSLLMGFLPLLVSVKAMAAEGEGAYKTSRDQAIHYYKQDKKRWKISLNLLRKATSTSDGAKDWRSWYNFARIANEQNVLEDAFPAAVKSLEVATRDGQKQKSRAMVNHLKRTFGAVAFSQDKRQAETLQEGYIILDVDKAIINMQKKKVFNSIKERFAEMKVALPKTLYLPFGEYKANGAPFVIKKGEEAKAVLFLFAEPGAEEGIPLLWLIGGITGAAALVAGIGAWILITDDHQDIAVDAIITK